MLQTVRNPEHLSGTQSQKAAGCHTHQRPGLLVAGIPLGLNLVVFPESYGFDATDNARMCFVSYIMCALVLPFTFAAINYLAF